MKAGLKGVDNFRGRKSGAKIAGEIVAAGGAGAEIAEVGAPACGEAAGVLLVAGASAEGCADVVMDDAAEGDGVDEAGGGGFEAEVEVFAAVDEAFVEAAEAEPQIVGDEEAGAGDGGDFFQTAEEWRGCAVLFGFAAFGDEEAGVVNLAGADGALDVTDDACVWAERGVDGEHGLEPARGEDEIVVEENEEVAGGKGGGAVVGGGVAEVAIVEEYADVWMCGAGGKCTEPIAGAVGTGVVDKDDLVVETGRERRLKRGKHGLREGQAVVERDEEGDAHAGWRRIVEPRMGANRWEIKAGQRPALPAS